MMCHDPTESEPVFDGGYVPTFDGGYGIPYQQELPTFDGGYGIPYQQELPTFDGGQETPSLLDPVGNMFEALWGSLWGDDTDGPSAGGNNAPNSGSSESGSLDWLFEDEPMVIPTTGGV